MTYFFHLLVALGLVTVWWWFLDYENINEDRLGHTIRGTVKRRGTWLPRRFVRKTSPERRRKREE